jgi:plasmid replication initiation protein
MWAVGWVGCVNTIKFDRKLQPAVVRQNNDPTQFYCYYKSTKQGKEINDIFYEGKFVHFLATEGNRNIGMAPHILKLGISWK